MLGRRSGIRPGCRWTTTTRCCRRSPAGRARAEPTTARGAAAQPVRLARPLLDRSPTRSQRLLDRSWAAAAQRRATPASPASSAGPGDYRKHGHDLRPQPGAPRDHDAMIIRTRRRLLAAAQNLRDEHTTPPGVDAPEQYRVRAGGIFLQRGADWVAETSELRKAFSASGS